MKRNEKIMFICLSVNTFHLSKWLSIRITMASTVILYGCKTRFPTVREKHRFRVFQNKVLRGECLDLSGKN